MGSGALRPPPRPTEPPPRPRRSRGMELFTRPELSAPEKPEGFDWKENARKAYEPK